MGIVNSGLPKELIIEVNRQLELRYFVETGTHVGTSALWASQHFGKIFTVELEPSLFERSKLRLGQCTNVEQWLGRSVEMLRSVVPQLDAPAMFWLDAHWSGGDTGGEPYPCPVLEEIAAIDAGPLEHVVMIDDARGILNAEPPFTPGRWPEIGMVVARLRQRHPDAYVAVHSDVVFRVPRAFASAFEAILRSYAREPEQLEPGERTPRSVYDRIRETIRPRRRLRALLERLHPPSGPAAG